MRVRDSIIKKKTGALIQINNVLEALIYSNLYKQTCIDQRNAYSDSASELRNACICKQSHAKKYAPTVRRHTNLRIGT